MTFQFSGLFGLPISMTPDSRLKLHSDKPVFDETVMFIRATALTALRERKNIWTSSLFTSLEPQLTCLFGPKPYSIRSLSRQTRVKSRHVSWQSMHTLMMVTEAMLQMMKGAKSCHLSYLQKAAGSSVACCNHKPALREARISEKPKPYICALE